MTAYDDYFSGKLADDFYDELQQINHYLNYLKFHKCLYIRNFCFFLTQNKILNRIQRERLI